MTALMIFLVLLLVLVEGFYSGSETAMTSANRMTIRAKADEGDNRAEVTLSMLSRLESVIGTTLVGTNLAIVAGTTLAEKLIHQHMPGEWESLINTLIMTPIILILGEMVPKSLGRSHADTMALAVSRPLRFSQLLFTPVIAFTDRIAGFLAGLMHARPVHDRDHVTRDDLKAMAELAEEQGLLPQTAGTMLRTVFELDTRPLSAIMVPLVNVRSVPLNATVAQVEALSAETGFTRFPVYEGRVDEVIGIIDLRPILYAQCGGQAEGEAVTDDTLITPFIQRHVVYVPETKSVGDLIHELRYHHLPMAAVVDEHGGVVGMVTTEDLVEEVVGEIRDERDPQERHHVTPVDERTYECDGRLSTRYLEEDLDLEIEKNGFETVAGFMMKLAGRIPHEGDRFTYRNYEFKVLRMIQRRVERVQIRRLAD